MLTPFSNTEATIFLAASLDLAEALFHLFLIFFSISVAGEEVAGVYF